MKRLIRDSPIKRAILTALRGGRLVSGEKLAGELGISRVAVWKNVHELIRLGYRIDGTPKGYILKGKPDVPYPWELPVRSFYLPTTRSTMEVAWKLAEKEPAWTFVIAGRQTGGRGRKGTRWYSGPGGLYLSVILRPELSLRRVGDIAGPALETLREALTEKGVEPWVEGNGLYTENGKLGGVLIEAAGELDAVRFAVLGVGLNVYNKVPQGGTSMEMELGERPSLRELASAVVNALASEKNVFKRALHGKNDD